MSVIKCKQCGNMCDDSLGECSFCKSSLDYKVNVAPKKNNNKTYESECRTFLAISVVTVGVIILLFVYISSLKSNLAEYRDKSEENITKYFNLKDEYKELQKEVDFYKDYKSRYDIVASDYKEIVNSEAYKMLNEIDGLLQDKEAISKEIEEQRLILSDLREQITNASAELKDIESQPIQFSAGEYICGQDFEVGRYLIYDGRSNFFVTGGKTYVNIILGDDPSWGQIEEYVHYFTEGEVIQANSPFKLKKVD